MGYEVFRFRFFAVWCLGGRGFLLSKDLGIGGSARNLDAEKLDDAVKGSGQAFVGPESIAWRVPP